MFRHRAGKQSDNEGREALVAAFCRQRDRALVEQRFRFADHFCDKILAEDPRDLRTWLVKGHLAWRHFNDHGRALNCFRQVLILGGYESTNEHVARARVSLAQLLEQLA
jgi:hypothetical protein